MNPGYKNMLIELRLFIKTNNKIKSSEKVAVRIIMFKRSYKVSIRETGDLYIVSDRDKKIVH